MGQVALVVASHGEFAKYALDSAEMVVGKQENCGVLTVSMELSFADVVNQMEEVFHGLDRSNGTVILVDILGGTPSNVSGRLALTNEGVLVVSGLNLPLLIELLTNRDRSLEDIGNALETAYHSSFVNVSRLFKEREKEHECEIL